VADLLRAIRQKIEREHAKVYPEAAHRKGIEGTVEVRFRIAGDGSAEAVEVVRSSGFPLLDELSVQTIRRAAPYPLVVGWIRSPLVYRLDQ
jgi:periplasmic protein TonB